MVDIGRRRGWFDVAATAAAATSTHTAHSHIRTALICGRGTATRRRMSSDMLLTGAWSTHTGGLVLLGFGTASRLFDIRGLVLTVRDGDYRRGRRSIVDCDRLLFAIVTAVAVVYVTSASAAVVMTAARSMVYATTAHHHAAAAAPIASVRRRRMVYLYIVRSTQAASTATAHRSGVNRLIVVMMMVVSTATAAGLLQLGLCLLLL